MAASMSLPDIDEACSSNFAYRDFIQCSETWWRTRVDNVPRQAATYAAMRQMADSILEPLSCQFVKPRLTYAFSSSALVRLLRRQSFPNVTPTGDQHASCELNRNGSPICDRLGIAVDLYVPGVGSLEIARWLMQHTPFDRRYFYSDHRPFHVSIGPQNNRSIVEMRGYKGGRHQPHNTSIEKFPMR